MKNELKQVRDLTRAKIRAGNVPAWSWDHHVQLIEAIDAVLGDISLMTGSRKTPASAPSERVSDLARTKRDSRNIH